MAADHELICPSCGHIRMPTERFCRGCGYEFLLNEIVDDEKLVFAQGAKRRTFSIWRLASDVLICLTVVGILAYMAQPDIRRPYPAREKACYANMRVLLGAIEMYNMDNDPPMIYLNPEMMEHLVKQQYLKVFMTGPTEACAYSSTGNMTASGQIVCASHGTVE